MSRASVINVIDGKDALVKVCTNFSYRHAIVVVGACQWRHMPFNPKGVVVAISRINVVFVY